MRVAAVAVAGVLGFACSRGAASPSVAHADNGTIAPSSGLSATLRAPSEEPAWVQRELRLEAPPDEYDEVFVTARHHDTPVFAARSRRAGRGLLRRGAVVSGERAGRYRGGCRGHWLRIAPEAYVCTRFGARIGEEEPAEVAHPMLPELDAPLPYRYATVRDRTAHRFDVLPGADVLADLQEGRRVEGAELLDGDYFVAVAAEEDGPDGAYVRTVRNRYVSAAALEPVTPSELHGELDEGGLSLPLAFVHVDDARAFRVQEGDLLRPAGRVERYARFAVASERTIEGKRYLLSEEGLAVREDDARVVRPAEVPEEVPLRSRWIHVDLDQQTLTAYEGVIPVFATLVATGKEGYDTPTGTYRVRHKYVSTTMRGSDPVDGVYDVAEVPWTMYYYRGYALHGAYWHDAFGSVRSHGCTNIAPRDARFLFSWATPTLPEGWHGVREEGTWLHFTRAEEAETL